MRPNRHSTFVTSIAESAWPAIPSQEGARLLSVIYQMEHDQWQSPEYINERQFQQATVLLQHAYQSCSYYRQRLDSDDLHPDKIYSPEQWSQLPILERGTIQREQKSIISTAIPKQHGACHKGSTSGSTGQSIDFIGTQYSHFIWKTHTLRDHLWHQRDFTKKIAYIRDTPDNDPRFKDGLEIAGWGPITNTLFHTTASVALDVSNPIEKQCRWLIEQNPTYLHSYASNLNAIAAWFEQHNKTLPALEEAIAFGEVVQPESVVLFNKVFNAKLYGIYTSKECGYMALQCGESGNYHVQSESVLLEVISDTDEACKPGEIGRVIVTTLHNFAMPLIRYAIGDYAEVGEACGCGRGLPTIRRIMGRERNMLTLHSGDKQWPRLTQFKKTLLKALPSHRFQIVQTRREVLEVRIESDRHLSNREEQDVARSFYQSINYFSDFDIRFLYLDHGTLSSNEKLEDFRSELVRTA
ncbi:hypothetical protein BOW53_08530 [Solemya pervernicosa gill symbiont]|uniref:AMP-dependent synthetase/ligase domain-containing protein n=2 Tax=Gammaproteobacteria incertae sedis TaxID=118884 RepID=A0A1T2L5I7_9GAMM|nr:phenylacetate--CoA ligase family protein [Candidatus Reidiella endopervernicosa]OOZ40206.1 hypothetical protein BOW53_08530 [Solemya pervernicosa gill symbiont]QKQ27138.1 phenylacetate--CoA ligase family protein [Candidatus Reidiella endopervernicosa]